MELTGLTLLLEAVYLREVGRSHGTAPCGSQGAKIQQTDWPIPSMESIGLPPVQEIAYLWINALQSHGTATSGSQGAKIQPIA